MNKVIGIALGLAVAVALGGGTALGASYTTEKGFDRPGSDYHRFELEKPRPGACRKACASDVKCKAYSYVKPGVQAKSAVCYLKNKRPKKKKSKCCVSGIKARDMTTEKNINRPGRDYRKFKMGKAKPAACRQACAADERCKAFTYVKPGAQSKKAMCWLKEGKPAKKKDACCVSGVKRN